MFFSLLRLFCFPFLFCFGLYFGVTSSEVTSLVTSLGFNESLNGYMLDSSASLAGHYKSEQLAVQQIGPDLNLVIKGSTICVTL